MAAFACAPAWEGGGGRYRTRHLAARDEQDEEDYQKEPKDVVVLVEPDRREDEEQLDEDGAEGQHAAYQDSESGLHVPRLRRDAPRDEVRLRRVCQRLRSAAEMCARKDEGHRDPCGGEGGTRAQGRPTPAAWTGRAHRTRGA